MATGIPVTTGELIDAATINTWARGYLRKTTAKTVASSTSATDLLNGEFTIPAGALGIDKILRLSAWGDWKQNSGGNRDVPTFQLLFGGTTFVDTDNLGANNVEPVNARSSWKLCCEIQNLGATNSQQVYLSGNLSLRSVVVADAFCNDFTTGRGTVSLPGSTAASSPGQVTYDGGNTGAVDTTASCALLLKVINAFNDANYDTKLLGALVEII